MNVVRKLGVNRLPISLVRIQASKAGAGRLPTFVQSRRNTANTTTTTPSAKATDENVTLEKHLTKQLVEARKSRDTFKSNVLRTVIGELQTEQKLLSPKQATPQVLEETALKSVRRAVSRRKAAALEYRETQRMELAETEEQEATYLESLLPKEMDPQALREAVESAYRALKSDGSIAAASSVQGKIQLLVDKVNEEHGKGCANSGAMIGILMPLLQKDGLMGSKGKKP